MERAVPSRTRAVRLAAELLPVLLVLASLAGTLTLILAMYRRHAPTPKPPTPAVVDRPPPPAAEPPPPVVLPPSPPPPPEPAEDPTPRIVAEIEARRAEHVHAAEQADRRTRAQAEAIRAPLEELARRTRRAMLVRTQLKALEERAHLLETEAEVLELERDVLGRERDAAKAALAEARARARAGFAILPYKGPNGTWRRPIPIECRDGMAVLEPDGPSISLLELGLALGVRSHPLIAGVLHAAARIDGTNGPDGAPVEPYVLFVVRPDGIRPFYEARGRLEALGIPFGYELIDQEMEIEYPALDDPSVWDSVPGARAGLASAPADRPGAGARPGPGPLAGRTPGLGGSLGPGATSPAPGSGMAPRGSPGVPGFFPPSGSGMPARGPRGEVISRGPTGAARLTSPAPSPVPSRGTRVEIVPRDREGLLGIEDDASRPSWRALIDAQEGRDRSADARGDTGRPRGPSEIPDGARQLGAPGPLTPALSPGGGGQKWPEGSRGNGTDGGSVTGQGGPDGVPVGRAERALEVVVACGPKGVTVHPGGYRLTTAVLKAEEGRLASTVRTIVAARRAAEPGVSWRPGLRFLVEPGGQATYWSARRQMLWAGVDWPVALQVAEVDAVRTLKWERW